MPKLAVQALQHQLPFAVVVGFQARHSWERPLNELYDQRVASIDQAISSAMRRLKLSCTGPVSKGRDGARDWPECVGGSISYKGAFGVVAVCRSANGPIGIDIEYPDGSLEGIAEEIGEGCLPPGLPRETALLVAFSAKESVFKAQFPVTAERLEFEDVALDWSSPTAARATCLGISLNVRAWNAAGWVSTSATLGP